MTKLNSEQERLLNELRKADIAWRNAKEDAFTRAQQIADREVTGVLAVRDQLVRKAVEAKIPKLQIRLRGLGTTSPHTLDESLERTSLTAAMAAVDPHPERYLIEDDHLIIRLEGDTLAHALSVSGFNATNSAAKESGLHEARFKLVERPDGSTYFTNVTELWLPEHMAEHPVVSWGMGIGNDEAKQWFEAHS